MPNQIPQTYANHARLDPPFHFFILPVFALTVIGAIVNLVMHRSFYSAWLVVITIAAAFAVVKARLYALKVQDRVIRFGTEIKTGSHPSGTFAFAGLRTERAPVDRASLCFRCGGIAAGEQSFVGGTSTPGYQEVSSGLASRLLEGVKRVKCQSSGSGSMPIFFSPAAFLALYLFTHASKLFPAAVSFPVKAKAAISL